MDSLNEHTDMFGVYRWILLTSVPSQWRCHFLKGLASIDKKGSKICCFFRWGYPKTMGLRFTSKGDNLDAIFERCMLWTTAKRFIHLEAGGHDELKTCLSQERRATGDESIEAMPRLVLVGVQAIGKIRSTFFSCETIEITWNRWLDTLDPRLGSEVLVATKWNDWRWSLHRFWSRWTSLTWRWRKPSNFARQWKFWNRWLSSSAIILKYLESSFPNRGTHSSRSWCKGTVPKGRRHEKATSIESHPSKVVRFLCILCVCGRSLMIRWTKLTRWSSAPCLHLIPGAYMIILMCERFWQHARDSFISSQLHTNHDVCFECFQRGNTIGFQSLKDLLKISECATAKVPV